jgi:hypothetical protein
MFFLFFISNNNKGPTGLKKAYPVDNGIYNHVKGVILSYKINRYIHWFESTRLTAKRKGGNITL